MRLLSPGRNGIAQAVESKFVVRYAKYEKRVKAFAVRFPSKNSLVVSGGPVGSFGTLLLHMHFAAPTRSTVQICVKLHAA